MNPLPSDLTGSDMSQWLNKGWCFAILDGVKQPCRYSSASHNSTPPRRVLVSDLEGKGYTISPQDLYPHWPLCGSLNLDGYAIYLSRLPRRQWRRTYNAAQVSMFVPKKWDVMRFLGVPELRLRTDAPEVVRAAFTPQYYVYEAAEQMLESGAAISVAISPYIIIVGDEFGKRLVYYKGKLIGKIIDNTMIPIIEDQRVLSRVVKKLGGGIEL